MRGTLTLGGTNSFSGITLSSGEVSVAMDANIGGPTSAITFNGGGLQITGTLLRNLDSHNVNVNWSSFNGTLDIATAGNTFTITQALAGTQLTKVGRRHARAGRRQHAPGNQRLGRYSGR